MFWKNNTLCVHICLFILSAPVICDITSIPTCTQEEIWTSGVSNYEFTYQGQATQLGLKLEKIYNCSRECCMSKCNYEKSCYQISQSENSSCLISSSSTISHVAQHNTPEWFTFNKCHRSCDAGFESVEGSLCTKCKAGKYKREAGSSHCINCPLDTFSETVGSVENDCQSCNRNTYTSSAGASSADECLCTGEFFVECCGVCFSLDCVESIAFFEFEGSISANEMSTNQTFIFERRGSVDYSLCVPSGDIDNNCSSVTSQNALRNTKFSLSKTIFNDNHVVLNHGFFSLYEMNTPGLAVSLWIMYDDNGPGNGHVFFESGNFSVSHPPLSTEIRIGGVIVDAEMYVWHNVFISLDRKRCLDVWFNSQHVCKCCSEIHFFDTNDNIELLGAIESKGVYVDDLRIYSEPIFFQEKCDLDVMCGAGKETLDEYTCTQCASGKYKKGGYGICEYCMEGTYSSLLGMSSCTNCPVNTYSPSNSTSLSSCLCDAGYSNAYSDSCVECVVGKYKNISGNIECVQCEYGKYSITSGATNSNMCISCPDDLNLLKVFSNKLQCMCLEGIYGLRQWPCTLLLNESFIDKINSTNAIQTTIRTYSTPTPMISIQSTPNAPAEIITEKKTFLFVTIVSFELDVGNIFISKELKLNIRLETSRNLEIDVLRIGLLETNQIQTRRRNLLSIKASFNITSTSKTESLKIEKDMSLNRLHSILSVIFDTRLVVSNLDIFTVQENMTPKIDGGTNIVMIISIIAGGIGTIIISMLVLVCVCIHHKKKLNGTSFNISLCEYYTVCNCKI